MILNLSPFTLRSLQILNLSPFRLDRIGNHLNLSHGFFAVQSGRVQGYTFWGPPLVHLTISPDRFRIIFETDSPSLRVFPSGFPCIWPGVWPVPRISHFVGNSTIQRRLVGKFNDFFQEEVYEMKH